MGRFLPHSVRESTMMTNNEIKGFRLAVYRKGCSRDHRTGGISSQVDEITMITAHHLGGMHEPTKEAPEFWLWAIVNGGIGNGGAVWVRADDLPLHELHENNTHLYLVPAGERPHTMNLSENFAYSFDRELRNICKYPIPIWERKK